jgi:hypothetical protein
MELTNNQKLELKIINDLKNYFDDICDIRFAMRGDTSLVLNAIILDPKYIIKVSNSTDCSDDIINDLIREVKAFNKLTTHVFIWNIEIKQSTINVIYGYGFTKREDANINVDKIKKEVRNHDLISDANNHNNSSKRRYFVSYVAYDTNSDNKDFYNNIVTLYEDEIINMDIIENMQKILMNIFEQNDETKGVYDLVQIISLSKLD